MSLSATTPLVLSELLSTATIELSLHADDRAGVLAELLGKIPELADKPQARLAVLRGLHERERLCGTAIGQGIALPHTRNTTVGIEEAIIVFGRHQEGIHYGAADGLPVKLIFLLLTPTVGQHLRVLARLSRVLSDAGLRQRLLEASNAENVLDCIREAEEKIFGEQCRS